MRLQCTSKSVSKVPNGEAPEPSAKRLLSNISSRRVSAVLNTYNAGQ